MDRRLVWRAVVAPCGVLAWVAGALMACGDPGSRPNGAQCANATPGNCPSPEPSFAHDVAPIVALRCNGCHGEGGVEQSLRDYTTYQGVFTHRAEIDLQVSNCMMPPPDAAAATLEERQTLLGWLTCGAKDN